MRTILKLHNLLVLVSLLVLFTQCDSVTDSNPIDTGTGIENEKTTPMPSQIEQIADSIEGKQAESVEFKLSDYFKSNASIIKTEFKSDAVEFEAAGNGIFVFSQADSITGTQIIDVLLVNQDSDTLNGKIQYIIVANPENADSGDENSGEETDTGSDDGSSSDETDDASDSEGPDDGSNDDDGTDDGANEDSDPETNPGDDTDNDTDPEPQPDPTPADLVIMPLGDSMTNDSRSRVTLWNLLDADGHDLDYVGNQYQESTIPDANHEGVGGIKIQGIADKIVSLMQTYKPDYVNLMVGTNDIAWYFDENADEIAARWNDLVQQIYDNSEAGTYVIAATIPPVSSKNVGKSGMAISDRAEMVKAYNKEIRKLVAARQAAGDNIVLADMEAALNVNEHVSGDGVHLNDTGYALMGTVYYHAITSTLQ